MDQNPQKKPRWWTDPKNNPESVDLNTKYGLVVLFVAGCAVALYLIFSGLNMFFGYQ